MTSITTEKAPQAVGPYSQAVAAGGLLFLSGQIALVPETGQLCEGGIEVQTEQLIANLRAVLQAAGCGLGDVVKTTCYLTDLNNFAAFNEVYGRHFTGRPARACVEVSALPKGVLAEIEAIAALPAGKEVIDGCRNNSPSD